MNRFVSFLAILAIICAIGTLGNPTGSEPDPINIKVTVYILGQ